MVAAGLGTAGLASGTVGPARVVPGAVIGPGRARELWVIAASNTPGPRRVALAGLPRSARTAYVYDEGRAVGIAHGTLTDRFRQWQVHIYRIRLAG